MSIAFRRLRFDRLIKVYMEENSPEAPIQPCIISEALLEKTSDYFQKALEHENRMGDQTKEKAALHFPEADETAWKVLLHWMYIHELPEHLIHKDHELFDVESLLNCWILGDKYIIPDFQDPVMLSLLHFLDECSLSLLAIQFNVKRTAPQSKLRKLLVEQMVFEIREGSFDDEDDLDGFDGAVGFTGGLIAELRRYAALSHEEKSDYYHFSKAILVKGSSDGRTSW